MFAYVYIYIYIDTHTLNTPTHRLIDSSPAPQEQNNAVELYNIALLFNVNLCATLAPTPMHTCLTHLYIHTYIYIYIYVYIYMYIHTHV